MEGKQKLLSNNKNPLISGFFVCCNFVIINRTFWLNATSHKIRRALMSEIQKAKQAKLLKEGHMILDTLEGQIASIVATLKSKRAKKVA